MKPIKPQPPADASRYCDPMPQLEGDDGDQWGRWAGRMVDWGRDCSLRHRVLSDWARGK